ncbi:MAG: hypothetical protein KatS3mg064_1068 [Tepidiforma sp.]|nr:hypothetical protein [Tepidiforma sp.]GIW17911.1 MAG: hypothetical protein KatS3mg064_1068 [Tepidiforma sp.]
MPTLVRLSRTAASTLLGIAAALLVTLGVIRLWLADVLYDEDRFAATAVSLMENEAVRAEVRRVVVDQAIDQQPDLLAARPLLDTVVDTALTSRPFERILEAAARDLHRAIFSSDRQSFVLNISDISTLAQAGLRAYDPELADRLPGGPNLGTIEVASRGAATRLMEVDRQLRALTWVVLAAAAACFVASGLVGGSFRAAATAFGIGLVGGALLTWLGIAIVAELLETRVPGSRVAREAARETWLAYSRELRSWMWLQAAAGVVIASVASSLVATASAREQAAAVGRWFAARWEQRLGRVGLSGLGVAAGVVLFLSPAAAGMLAARAAGLAIAYLAGVELLRTLGLAREAARRDAPRAARREAAIPAVFAGSTLALAGLAVAGLFWLNRDAFRAPSSADLVRYDGCNGLEELCDRRLDQVLFPSTHNSMSAAESPGWFLAEHLHPIDRQLRDGIRAFLIDVYYGYPTGRGVRTDPALTIEKIEPYWGPEASEAAARLADTIGPIPQGAKPGLYLCHGYCELGATPFEGVMRDLRAFLRQHPGEVVILVLQDYVDPFDVEKAMTRTGLIDYAAVLEWGQPLPTLRQLIETDRRLLVFSENVKDAPAPPWYHDAFTWMQDTPFLFRSAEEFSCEPFRGRPDSPLFLINHWVSRFPPSTRDALPANSAEVLRSRIERCWQERGMMPNIISVNFSSIGDLFAVVEEVNRKGPQE